MSRDVRCVGCFRSLLFGFMSGVLFVSVCALAAMEYGQ